MAGAMSDDRALAAIEVCASEPVHTPGTVQPFGHLLAADPETGLVRHASANCAALFGTDIASLMGQHVRDLLGGDTWHAARNTVAQRNFAQKRHFVAHATAGTLDHSVHLSAGGPMLIFEIEAARQMPKASPEALQEQAYLLDRIQGCADQVGLFDLTTRLLRHVTGFDRVMIYRFDPDWNGEVLAEAHKSTLSTFKGLRFPHGDIPEQARAIMARLQIRVISDVDQTPVPILAESDSLPPLDISLAQIRGVSPIHMQYLRNMGSAATMTLSVVLDGVLWGMISFHHGVPRVVSSEMRQILTGGVLPVFCLKLGLLRGQASISLSKTLDALQADIQSEVEQSTKLSAVLDAVGPPIRSALDVSGMAVATGSQTYSDGSVPDQPVIEALIAMAQAAGGEMLAIESLSATLPGMVHHLNGAMGALVTARADKRSLLFFRKEIREEVSWAGDPTKRIETVAGNTRIRPRGSFSTYLQVVQGRCKAWSATERHLAGQLWPLLSAAERQAFMNDLTRQQMLMIGELNHRVRNILALVKSVSQQARRDGGSLESYSQALEARIHALAAAHDIGSGAAMSAVSVKKIIELEIEPYRDDTETRIDVSGSDISVRAEVAPIFALVIHEMMTNAVKYGALSNTSGTIRIDIDDSDPGCVIEWVEDGGPPVSMPASFGFGTTLIRQAVPYEMEGTAELDFAPGGVRLKLWLPPNMLDWPSEAVPTTSQQTDLTIQDIPAAMAQGVVLIVEDNFMIATDLASELARLGFKQTEIFARAEDALDFVATTRPALALLDINLGQGLTSEAVATHLFRLGVPCVFVTGYGEEAVLPSHLSAVPTLTKPVSRTALTSGLSRLVSAPPGRPQPTG